MGILKEMQRAHARQVRAQRQVQAAAYRHHRQLQREAERAMKEAQRAAPVNERERKRLYAEARIAEVAAMNADLQLRLDTLDNLLAATLEVDDHIDFSRLKKNVTHQPFNPGKLGSPLPPPDWRRFEPSPPTILSKMFGGQTRYQQQLAIAQHAFAQSQAEHATAEADRQRKLAAAHQSYQRRCAKIDEETAAHNAEIDRFAAAFAAGEPAVVVEYFSMVLGNSVYPDDFPQQFRLAYVPESRQLVVEYHLPTLDVVPPVREYRYVKVRDEITSATRPAKDSKERYANLVAQLTLRTVHELFEADRAGLVDTIVFNGIVDTTDPRTGASVQPCLVTLRTTRDVFSGLHLGMVEPSACLHHLNASVSRRPAELAPVRPVLEFDMVDKRFVDEVDVLADLDQRPNLLKLSPTEFESLIQNLFAKMGLDTKQTRPSRDGGVDCVAFDPRPIFGGKVVIQAKRYRNTVDVSSVRDLFGTVQNEGASKGILVTTSGYGPASYQFASGKPLELIDGSNLLFLLAEHAEVKARVDPSELD
ncbi:restriction system protein [Micromonospora phaseoli]|uniref:Restriction system protein n=1 Tax=Micromonospora phaseoli TaxID=1144548 RepID=A0A1H7CQ49_9ACTN|nr:restriction endonuclease [Micromonospora phaseoli]PZV91611.1 restriction system protein [Micromonospora phaseoli]GIJ79242.1 restriction endonuclease [Micromonospora phaseoli]SEJ91788.1 restriction system protein [Micromonospora phaseoli]